LYAINLATVVANVPMISINNVTQGFRLLPTEGETQMINQPSQSDRGIRIALWTAQERSNE
jgi:hypothetical protein